MRTHVRVKGTHIPHPQVPRLHTKFKYALRQKVFKPKKLAFFASRFNFETVQPPCGDALRTFYVYKKRQIN